MDPRFFKNILLPALWFAVLGAFAAPGQAMASPKLVAGETEYFVRHHSNYDLDKYIAYTKDKTPEETCEEVLQSVRSNGWTYEPEQP